MVPFCARARVCRSPAASCEIGGKVAMRRGSCRLAVVPSPSCPWLVSPHDQARPSVSITTECRRPATMRTIGGSPSTIVGCTGFGVAGKPSCPSVERPQAITWPVLVSASTCASPATTATKRGRCSKDSGDARVRPKTAAIGSAEAGPQPISLPSERRAKVKSLPVAI